MTMDFSCKWMLMVFVFFFFCFFLWTFTRFVNILFLYFVYSDGFFFFYFWKTYFQLWIEEAKCYIWLFIILCVCYVEYCYINSINNVEIIYFWLLQLPPPPQIELVVDKPHLNGVVRRPLVRIRRKLNFVKNPLNLFINFFFL